MLNTLLAPVHFLGAALLGLYFWAVLIYAITSWLVAFNVVNTHQPFVRGLLDFLNRINEPALRPIRRFIPSLGGVDLSPILLLLLIQAARIFWDNLYMMLIG